MQLGFEKEEYLVSSFGAMGTQKGGLRGRMGKGVDRHNSAESCLKSEPQILCLGFTPHWSYRHLSGSKPMRTQSLPQGRKSWKERAKETERDRNIFSMLSESRHTQWLVK